MPIVIGWHVQIKRKPALDEGARGYLFPIESIKVAHSGGDFGLNKTHIGPAFENLEQFLHPEKIKITFTIELSPLSYPATDFCEAFLDREG